MTTFGTLTDNIERIILGKRESIELVVSGLLARGHVLIEDVPGLGKTILARALARSLRADFQRIQCTPDLLPSDITGVSVYNPKDLNFGFRPGPVFTNVLLADEINRATPRTQSALLEAMEEAQVTVEGTPRSLPSPFFLIATENPIEMAGTFPLPEAQLDRFLLRVSLGYPDDATEIDILAAQKSGHPIEKLEPVLDLSQIAEAQEAVEGMYIHDSLLGYIQKLVAATRGHDDAAYGASPRGGLALMRTAQALATILDAPFVTPDQIKRLVPHVLAHRIVVKPRSRVQGVTGDKIVDDVLRQVEVPVDYEPVS